MSSKQQQCLSIYIIGSLNVDLVSYTSRIPNEGETLTSDSFATGWGGKGANQAVATAKLATPSSSATKSRSGGARKIIVKMIGAVGDDEFGSPLKRELGANDIDTTDVRVESGQRTGVAVIMVETSNGENRILVNPGANATVLPDTIPASLFSRALPMSMIIMQLETPIETIITVCKKAKECQIPVLLNPAPAIPLPDPLYESLDVIVVNQSEASLLSGISFPSPPLCDALPRGSECMEAARGAVGWFIDKGCNHVVLTLGALGAVYAVAPVSTRDGGAAAGKSWEIGYQPAVKPLPGVVDTTAAGDTFVGALATSLVRDWADPECVKDISTLAKAVAFAVKAAAWTVARKGTWSAMPSLADLQDL